MEPQIALSASNQSAPALQAPATFQPSTMVRAGVPLLCSALLLILLAASQTTGVPVASELRCQCLQTIQGVQFKNIQSVKVTPPGAHCTQTEVIATLKSGREVCLNPEAPMVEKILQKILKNGNSS